MFSERHFGMMMCGAAIGGAAFWLFRESQAAKERRLRVRNWSNEKRKPQPMEYWLNETIEASFPASDPPASTPVLGTGRQQ